MPRVLLAPNAFKGSLSSVQAAEAMADGARLADATAECRVLPMADGGDGSVDAFVAAGFTRMTVTVPGPTGVAVDASVAMRGTVAAVELADACGMARLPGGTLAPMTSSTAGLGHALRAVLDEGATEVVVCLGGSASTDGGAGLLQALGARLLDARGEPVPPMGQTLADVARVELTGLHPRLREVALSIAVDVNAPLFGPQGAAAVFAPQKGASPEQVDRLDAGLRQWHEVLSAATGRDVSAVPGSGAAGGTAAALLATTSAVLVPGAELIAAVLGLEAALDWADVVVTGEGRLDAQTGLGKGAAWVAERARAAGRPAVAVCGRIDLDPTSVRALGFDAWADCTSLAGDEAKALEDAADFVAVGTEAALRQLWRSTTTG